MHTEDSKLFEIFVYLKATGLCILDEEKRRKDDFYSTFSPCVTIQKSRVYQNVLIA